MIGAAALYKDDVKRYLRHTSGELSQEWEAEIDAGLEHAMRLSRPNEVCKSFRISVSEGITFLDYGFKVPSKALEALLGDANEVWVVACTIGHDITNQIKREMICNPSRGIILDACASVVIEAYAESINNRLAKGVRRFSPGYGDFDLSFQKVFAKLLDMEKNIGVYLSPAGLMVPEKSILFLLGSGNMKNEEKCVSCETCLLSNCEYRRR